MPSAVWGQTAEQGGTERVLKVTGKTQVRGNGAGARAENGEK